MKLFLSLFILSTLLACAVDAAEGGWQTQYNVSLEEAAKERKLVLLNFTGSDWCGWCIKLDKEIFSDEQFLSFAKDNLVLVTVDFPRRKIQPAELAAQNAALGKRYRIDGFPTLVLLNSEGKEISRNVGYLPGGPEGFINWVKEAAKK